MPSACCICAWPQCSRCPVLTAWGANTPKYAHVCKAHRLPNASTTLLRAVMPRLDCVRTPTGSPWQRLCMGLMLPFSLSRRNGGLESSTHTFSMACQAHQSKPARQRLVSTHEGTAIVQHQTQYHPTAFLHASVACIPEPLGGWVFLRVN